MHLFGRTQPLDQHPIDECLAIIGRLGFDGAEICLENPDIAPAALTAERARGIGSLAAAAGLRNWSVSYHKDYISDDLMLEETLKAIRLTPHFGSRIFVFAGAPRRVEDAGQWSRMIQRTRQLVGAAEECGVTLAIEFEPGFVVGSTEDLHRLLSEIPSPALQVNLDLGHVFLCDADPLAAIASLAGRIAHGHIENMAAGVHKHLLPWLGDMDLAAYLKVLAQAGFAGPLALDLYNEDYEQVSPQCLQFLRELPGGYFGT